MNLLPTFSWLLCFPRHVITFLSFQILPLPPDQRQPLSPGRSAHLFQLFPSTLKPIRWPMPHSLFPRWVQPQCYSHPLAGSSLPALHTFASQPDPFRTRLFLRAGLLLDHEYMNFYRSCPSRSCVSGFRLVLFLGWAAAPPFDKK